MSVISELIRSEADGTLSFGNYELDVDSIRIYRLGNSYKNKIEVMGKTSVLQAGEPLLL